ncbi:hypothetical protein [Streptomyces sp. NPDC089799]
MRTVGKGRALPSPDLGRILLKLELRDRIQAVVFAHENRLVPPA